MEENKTKAVMISIRPEWGEKILKKQKVLEVRRTAPLLRPPFKCYIYLTRGEFVLLKEHIDDIAFTGYQSVPDELHILNRKVVAEFVCDRIECLKAPDLPWSDPNGERECRICKESCLTFDQIAEYGKGSNLWGWHISDLKIYDEPKKITDFEYPCPRPSGGYNCYGCKYQEQISANKYGCNARVLRPPQSWCYVEDV